MIGRLTCSFLSLLLMVALAGCFSRRIDHGELEAMLSKPGRPFVTWDYAGSSDKDHNLVATELVMFFQPTDRYKISREELHIPRTYRRGEVEAESIFNGGIDARFVQQLIDALPHYRFKRAGDKAVLSAIMSNGKPRWEREYLVKQGEVCVPHGHWRQYDLRGGLARSTEYRDGRVKGRHWVKLDWQDLDAREIETYWDGETPVGVWTVDPGDVKHILIHFKSGKEVLKESFGASSGKKILLRKWENGKMTYEGDWVRVAPPKIVKRHVYMGERLRPDFEPKTESLAELEKLAGQ